MRDQEKRFETEDVRKDPEVGRNSSIHCLINPVLGLHQVV